MPLYGKKGSNPSFSVKRMKRGLYQSKNGVIANADVNRAGNIMMKMIRKAFKEPFACA